MRFLSLLKTEILNLIFPLVCLGCGREGTLLCTHCRQSLDFIPPSCIGCRKFVTATSRIPAGRTCHSCRRQSNIFAFLSPFSYDYPLIRELIHLLKYSRVQLVAPVLAEILSEYFVRFQIIFPPQAIIIPIPLSRARTRIRGFNQSELIGRLLAEKLGLVLDSAILVKVRNTPPQTELSRSERLLNARGAMKVISPEKVKNATLILLDDVKTTGATLDEAASLLKEAGAKRIWAVTVAH